MRDRWLNSNFHLIVEPVVVGDLGRFMQSASGWPCTDQEETVIIICEKGSRAIISALDTVMRIGGNFDSLRSRCLAILLGT